ncbi:uncharacterized protein KIAA1671 homolog isoform X1 [Coturnix japonica]|uniref:KIAA1671 n=1 Tax=Coturnix japonica TaxID=93934 RepID=A0A8C2T9W9_COTJA|nr:uncharacterized protein KIAA1671 homolog isoform X1 [Coturnix japonica]XP_015733682.1 uncharacterized protein KIAA1671 homolog isoform X1 [Coturnix japonica]
MATRVEINSTLASLTTVPDLNEIRTEDKSQRVYVSVLSDVSSKAKEPSASLTLEEKSKFGSTLRSATMPSLGSRPRLFPKPFSKDTPSDTFANVKPPITSFRTSSLIRKPSEETTSAKVSAGNVPPLVDQKVIGNESKAGGEVVTNMTFYSGHNTNTVILFETAGTEQSKVSLAQGKRAADDHRVLSTIQTKESQSNVKQEKPSQPSHETSRSPEGSLHRQILLSSSVRPVSWNSLKTGEKKDAPEDRSVEKTNTDANNINNKVGISLDVQQRPKPRPVSAVFLESLRDQTHRTVEASEEKSPTEKSWVRKPRPLSMDLTAKFELKDLSTSKKACSSHESKETVSVTSFTDVGSHGQSETGPKTEEIEFNKGSSSKTNLKCSSQEISILNKGKHTWETKQKSESEQTETKPSIVTNLYSSERAFESAGESRTNREGKRLDQKETCVFLSCESPAASSEKENSIVRGSVKKHISLFTSENPGASVDTETLPSAAERENKCVNIQQRIKELTTESTDAKPGNLRRSLQSRPLSADLTKMFSSPTSSTSEVKPEKAAEVRNNSGSEMQEHQKSKEITMLAHREDPTEAHAAGNPWKSRQVVKITNRTDQTETKGSFPGDSQRFSQQSENSISFTSSFEKRLKPTNVTEKTCIKTVRATMFDHNVQRHNVADDLPGTVSPLKMSGELEAKPDVVTLGHTRRSWVGEAFPSKSPSRDPNDFFSSECTLSERKKDLDKTETDPVLIAEKIPYSTNRNKSSGVNEKTSKLHAEIKTDRSEDSSTDGTGRSNLVKCSSEKSSFRQRGVDYEFGPSFGHEVVSTSVKKQQVHSSSVLLSGQLCKSSSSLHPDVKEESRAFAVRRSLDSNFKDQDLGLHSTAPENREKIRAIDPEEKVRRTKSSISDLKTSERWRRKTLPHDSVKAEEISWLTPDNTKRLSWTDSLQLEENSLKKRNIKERMEGHEAKQTAPGSSDEHLKNQSSTLEPKATYFAVTYQISSIKKEKSFVGTAGTSVSSKISSSSEGGAVNVGPDFPGRSKPDKSIVSMDCREESREVYVKKDWVKGEDKDNASSKNIASSNFHVSGKDKCYEKGLDQAKEKIIDVDAFLLKQERENVAQTDVKSSRGKVSTYHEPRSSLHFAQLHKEGEVVTQKSSESSCGVSGRKAEDGYRLQVLDIDALMAEYKEESVKGGSIQDKVSEEHSLFGRSKSKNKRNVSDRVSSSYTWKEWKGSDHYAVSSKQGERVEEYHRPEKLVPTEKSKEKLDSHGPESDKQKSKDKKLGSPPWENPSCLFPDKFANSPVEFTAKKTFIIDDDQDVNLTSRNQSSQAVIDKVQPVHAVGVDQKLEVNFASRLSIKANDGLLQRKVVTKEQFSEVTLEGDWSKNVARSSVTKNRDDVNKVTCANDSSNVKSKTKDWKSSTSGLGSATPDLRRSYSEKSRPGKDGPSHMQEVRGKKELYRSRQSFPPESVDNGWKTKVVSQSESYFHEDKKAPRKEWTKQSSEKTDGREFSFVSTQRRSHSFFYKDRRTESITDQLKQCFTRQPPEAKDTDTLVQEPDSQYGTWSEQRRSGDSFVPESPSSENDVISTRKQPPNSQPSSLSSQTEPTSLADRCDFSKDQRSTSLDRSSTDIDSTDGTELPPPGDAYPDGKTTDFSFIDQTTILDSSALKNRVQLSKKRRHRAPLSHSVRRSRGLEYDNRFSLTEESGSTWMFKDSTEEKKPMQQEDSDEEEKTQRSGRLSSVQAQRLPIFPGMDHSVLKAQLRKRHESESPGEPSSAQPFKSPKPQLGTPGSRILPSSVEKEERSEEKSPQWLKELKSKKRQSHYENQV